MKPRRVARSIAGEATALLGGIDWSFSTPFSVGRSGARLFDCRRHHWYPATFIPEIPFTLIELLSTPGQVVYDPFGGVGTTAIQALALGRRALSTENCGVAVAIARSLWQLMDPRCDLALVVADTTSYAREFVRDREYSDCLPRGMRESVEILRPWYNPDTFRELVYLMWRGWAHRSTSRRAAHTVAFSATLKAVCCLSRYSADGFSRFFLTA